MSAPRLLPASKTTSSITAGTTIEDGTGSGIYGPVMRVRITQELRGSIDGIPLGRLTIGVVYDVNTPLACYLLSEEVAELALAADSVTDLPVERRVTNRRAETRREIVILPRAIAADRGRRRKQKGR